VVLRRRRRQAGWPLPAGPRTKHGQLWYLPAGRVEPGESFDVLEVCGYLDTGGVPAPLSLLTREGAPFAVDETATSHEPGRPPKENPIRRRLSLTCLLLAPVPALVIGLVVMSRAGVPSGLWLLNLAAAFAGVLVALAASRRPAPTGTVPSSSARLVALGLALLGATLIAPGLQGVHRWLSIGPVAVHVGAVVLPPLLVVLADVGWTTRVASSVLVLAILLLQPDTAQGASFAAGWSVCMSRAHGRRAAGPVAVAALLAGASLLRHDPLGTVPHVEGIVALATAQGLAWGVAGVIALALPPIAFAVHTSHPAGMALATYTAGTLVASWLGNHPVPVLGYGVSPILGYYLAVAALARPAAAGGRAAIQAA
jgi:hypothetical protein